MWLCPSDSRKDRAGGGGVTERTEQELYPLSLTEEIYFKRQMYDFNRRETEIDRLIDR